MRDTWPRELDDDFKDPLRDPYHTTGADAPEDMKGARRRPKRAAQRNAKAIDKSGNVR